MTTIAGSRDCGNSPKNKFAQEIGVSLESGEFLSDVFSDESVWEKQDEEIEGLQAIEAALSEVVLPTHISVEHAITHGKVGATSGVCTLPDGNSRRFSHIIEFTNTKANQVARIKSYS